MTTEKKENNSGSAFWEGQNANSMSPKFGKTNLPLPKRSSRGRTANVRTRGMASASGNDRQPETIYFKLLYKVFLNDPFDTTYHNSKNKEILAKLFLILMVRHDFLKEDQESLNEAFELLEAKSRYAPIADKVKSTILDFKEENIYKTIKKIEEINIKKGLNSFSDIICKLIFNLYKNEIKLHSLIELTDLLIPFIHAKDNIRFYDPLGYYPVYLLQLDSNDTCWINVQDEYRFTIGYLIYLFKLDPKGKTAQQSMNYRRQDKNWPAQKSNFDRIITFPIFKDRINFNGKEIPALEFAIKEGLPKLEHAGRMILLLPESFLYETDYNLKIRRELVKNQNIKQIIKLPHQIFPNSSMNHCLLILGKDNPKLTIVVADFSTVKIEEAHKRILDIQKNRLSNLKDVSIIDSSRIDKKRYIIEPKRFLISKQLPENGFKMIPLRQIFRLTNLEPTQPHVKKGHFLSLNDMPDEEINIFKVDLKLKFQTLPRSAKSLKDDVIVFPKFLGLKKPSILMGKNENYYIDNRLIPFILQAAKYDYEYVISEMNEPYVTKQLNAFANGNIARKLHAEDILSIEIKVPNTSTKEKSLQIQRAKILGRKEAYLKDEKTRLGLKQENDITIQQLMDDFDSFKHVNAQHLNNLKSGISVLLGLMNKDDKKPIYADTQSSKNISRTVLNLITDLQNTTQSLLTEFTSYSIANDSKSTTIKLQDYIEELVKPFKEEKCFKIKIKKSDDFQDEDSKENMPLVCASKKDLKTIFDNVIVNARQHGFEKEDPDNLIKIVLRPEKDAKSITLSISNNGKKADKDIDHRRFITRGEKSNQSEGRGIGGFDINRLAKRNDIQFKWLNKPTEEFSISYIFTFKIRHYEY